MDLATARNRRRVLNDHLDLVAVLAFALLLYAFLYVTQPYRPDLVTGKLGTFGGWDQSQYLNMARNLANLRLPPDAYLYGLGYPLLGVPFLKLFPADPFVLPDLALFLVTIALVYRVAEELLGDRGLAVASAVLITAATPLTGTIVGHWNSTVTIVAMAFLIFLAVTHRRIGVIGGLLIGLSLGWVFAARYVDALLIAPVAIFVLGRQLRQDLGTGLRVTLVCGLLATAMIGATLWSHYVSFGSPFRTPYAKHGHLNTGYTDETIEGYRLTNVPKHLFSTIVTPQLLTDLQYPSLLQESFFLAATPLGFASLWYLARRGLSIALAVSLGMSLVLYGSFRATGPYDLSHSLRYLSPWYPITTIMVMLVAAQIGRIGQRTLRSYYPLILGWLLTGGITLVLLMASIWSLLPEAAARRDRAGWQATTSSNQAQARLALDGSTNTHWDSGERQRKGMYYQVDMGREKQIGTVTLAGAGSAFGKFGDNLRIETSLDGQNWRQVNGMLPYLDSNELELTFERVAARMVRVSLNSDNAGINWVITEIYVH